LGFFLAAVLFVVVIWPLASLTFKVIAPETFNGINHLDWGYSVLSWDLFPFFVVIFLILVALCLSPLYLGGRSTKILEAILILLFLFLVGPRIELPELPRETNLSSQPTALPMAIKQEAADEPSLRERAVQCGLWSALPSPEEVKEITKYFPRKTKIHTPGEYKIDLTIDIWKRELLEFELIPGDYIFVIEGNKKFELLYPTQYTPTGSGASNLFTDKSRYVMHITGDEILWIYTRRSNPSNLNLKIKIYFMNDC